MPKGTNFTLSPPNGGVYMHPQILILGLKLPLTPFIHGVLSHLRIALSQLSGVAWRTVLGFEALCVLSAPNACQREVLCTDYRFFVPQIGYEKLIVNMMDNDHGMHDTVVRVSGP